MAILVRVLLEEGVVGGDELRDDGEGELLGFHGAPLGGDGLGGGGGGDRGESGNLVEARVVVMGGVESGGAAGGRAGLGGVVRLRGGRERAGRVYPRALVSAGGIPRGVVVREVETARAAHLRGGGDKLPGEHALRAGLGLSVGHRDEHARGKLWGPAPIYRRGIRVHSATSQNPELSQIRAGAWVDVVRLTPIDPPVGSPHRSPRSLLAALRTAHHGRDHVDPSRDLHDGIVRAPRPRARAAARCVAPVVRGGRATTSGAATLTARHAVSGGVASAVLAAKSRAALAVGRTSSRGRSVQVRPTIPDATATRAAPTTRVP